MYTRELFQTEENWEQSARGHSQKWLITIRQLMGWIFFRQEMKGRNRKSSEIDVPPRANDACESAMNSCGSVTRDYRDIS